MTTPGPVAIFPWGEVIEEYLRPLDLTFEDFVDKVSGGWLFGYAAALQAAGRAAVVVCASDAVQAPVRRIHPETGTPVWAVPGRLTRPNPNSRRPASIDTLAHWLAAPSAAFTQVLRDEGCSAVIAQEYEYARLDVLLPIARRLGLPLFASFQGGDVTHSTLERWVRPRALNACRGLIVASARERARLAATYPRLAAPIVPIPNPVDAEAWRLEDRGLARRALGLPQEAFVVFNHGRLDIRRKGLDVMLQAWRAFAADQPQARLMIVGSGQDHDAFAERLAALALPSIDWTPRFVTDRAAMRRWLSAADVYLTTSRVEGMPVAPLEAMACGLPVIATDAQGLDDIFADGLAAGGLVVPRGEWEPVEAALRRLAADPDLRRRMGEAARRRVETAFSFAAVGHALADVLDRPA